MPRGGYPLALPFSLVLLAFFLAPPSGSSAGCWNASAAENARMPAATVSWLQFAGCGFFPGVTRRSQEEPGGVRKYRQGSHKSVLYVITQVATEKP